MNCLLLLMLLSCGMNNTKGVDDTKSITPIASESDTQDKSDVKPRILSNDELARLNADLLDGLDEGDLQKVKNALSNGANVNAKDTEWDESAIHLAIENACISDQGIAFVHVLVEAGADINVKDEDGISPIHLVFYVSIGDENNTDQIKVEERKVEIIKYLVSKGAKINEKNKQGMTPLHSAISAKLVNCVKCLIELGADLTITNQYNETPLEYAESLEVVGTNSKKDIRNIIDILEASSTSKL